MTDRPEKDFAFSARRRVIIELIEASFRLAEEIGPHPLTDGCNCIDCAHRRKRALAQSAKDWPYRL